MDKQPFIERILETENLTDDLEDNAADYLLKWGLAQLDRLLEGVVDEAVAGGKVSALMKVMRGINRIIGGLPTPAPEKVADLAALYAEAFGTTPPPAATDPGAIAAEVTELEGLDAVKFLLDWVQKK